MATNEHTLQEFLSDTVTVISDLDDGAVVLHQDNGDDLVLMTRARHELLMLASQVAMHFARGDTTSVERALYWLEYLGCDRELCVSELAVGAERAAQTGHLAEFAELLYAWEATGLAAWDDAQASIRADDDAPDDLSLERPILS